MSCLRLYRRVLALLAPERGLAITLAVANAALAAAGFLGPLLFGSIVDTLASSGARARHETWQHILLLLGAWGLVGVGGIGAGILVALHADRLSQRRRLAAMSHYFEHVLRLPHAFHGGTHSGRQLKIMWQGADTLFGVWLSFLRENLATFVALFVLPTVGRAGWFEGRGTEAAGWGLRMIQLAVVATYFLSAVAKIREGGWLWGSSATLIWALSRRGDVQPAQWLSAQPALTSVMQWTVFMAELLSPVMLWLRGRALLAAGRRVARRDRGDRPRQRRDDGGSHADATWRATSSATESVPRDRGRVRQSLRQDRDC